MALKEKTEKEITQYNMELKVQTRICVTGVYAIISVIRS